MRKSYLSWFWAIMEDGAWDVEASESVSSPESDHWKEIFSAHKKIVQIRTWSELDPKWLSR